MGVVINTNVASLVAQNNLFTNNKALAVNVQRLSSGYRVNSSADDASGLARADQLRASSRGVQAALRNANDGISALEIADKSAQKISELLTRMSELAVTASQGTLDTNSRTYIQDEFSNLRDEISRIAEVTEFDGKKLLASGISINIQVGFRNNANNRMTVTMGNLKTTNLGIQASKASVAALTGAQRAISVIGAALTTLNSQRARFGSYTNRLDATISNLQVTYTNFQAAESRIRDLDFAQETASFTRNQILVQSGVSVLAQANTLPQSALSLIG